MIDTTVTVVKTPKNWGLRIALGIAGLVTLIILAFVFRVEASIIALVIGGGVAFRIIGWAIHQNKLSSYEQRKLEADTRIAEAEARKAERSSYFVETNTGVFVEPIAGDYRFYPAVSASKPFADVPLLAAPEVPRYRRLLDVDFIHMLVVGPTNAGKTTIANHLIDNAPNGTACIAIDAHGKFNTWSGRVSDVVGVGRDYMAIDKRLLALIAEMDGRYNGDEMHFQKVLVVIDEWLGVLEHCPSAGRFFETIGSESRKVNMSLIITTISATVDDLNVSAAVRDNLVQLTLNRSLKAQNLGELRWSRKDTELVELPGPYIRREPIALPETIELPPELDSGPVAYAPNSDELKVYELHLAGESKRSIYKKVFGKETVGGRQVDEIKEILSKFGVSA